MKTAVRESAHLWPFVCLMLALMLPPPAVAVPTTFSASGRITAVVDEAGLLDGSLRPEGDVDAHFTVRLDDHGAATIVFGDGSTGRRLPASGGVAGGSYRSGSGNTGNVTFPESCVFAIDCGHAAVFTLVLLLQTVEGLEQEFRMELAGLTGPLFEPIPFWDRFDQLGKRSFTWTFGTRDGIARVEGVVTGLQPVPEPSTLLLLVAALMLAGPRLSAPARP